jgi:uncharacterized protein YbaP (TraB family)
MRVNLLRCALGALLTLATAAAIAQTDAASPADCPPAFQLPAAAELQAMAREATDHGLLWKLSKDGHSSYLFGTIHVGRRAWLMPGPSLRNALQQIDTLALELDPADPATQRELAKAIADAPRPTLPADLLARLDAHVKQARCLDHPEALKAMPPTLQAVTLELDAARREGLDPALGQDVLLAGMAQHLHRRIIALESVHEQLEVIAPSDAEEATRVVSQSLDQIDDPKQQAVLQRMAGDWADGDLDDFERYAQWCGCLDTPADRAWMKRLIDDRNTHMAERFDALHREGGRVLVAVGTLHMIGPQGLPQLLKARGYEVERISRHTGMARAQ